MPNLLTKEHKKRLKKDYMYRLVTTLFVLIIGTALLSSVFLVPSYMLANSKEKGVEEDLSFLKKLITQRESEDATDEAREARGQLERISAVLEIEKPTKVFAKLVGTIPPRVSLTSIQYDRGTGEEGKIGEIRIIGFAEDRETLLTLTKVLEREDMFGNVDLPIASLAEKTDIKFSLLVDVFAEKQW